MDNKTNLRNANRYYFLMNTGLDFIKRILAERGYESKLARPTKIKYTRESVQQAKLSFKKEIEGCHSAFMIFYDDTDTIAFSFSQMKIWNDLNAGHDSLIFFVSEKDHMLYGVCVSELRGVDASGTNRWEWVMYDRRQTLRTVDYGGFDTQLTIADAEKMKALSCLMWPLKSSDIEEYKKGRVKYGI
jgi:hypothetical protein